VRLLLIGGPKFVGFALIEAALARGHQVTTFNRGQTNPDRFPEIEKLTGDRDGGLAVLEGRTWDAVLDTSGYVPGHVHDSAGLLAGAAGRYLFVSSISYYADYREPRVESDPPEELGDKPADRMLEDHSNYGALKALCEQEVEAAFGDRAVLVRPGLIVGPNDPTDRFTYWPRRAERGGPILAPPDQRLQMIDVRDLAEWMIALAVGRTSGVFNATGFTMSFSELLDECRRATGAHATFTWIGSPWLLGAGVEEWMGVPLWIASPGWEAANRVDVSKALGVGLSFRPLEDTVRGALEQAETTDAAGLAPDREAALLAEWHGRR
jgi:2'-hydroxyisoflavone reductase